MVDFTGGTWRSLIDGSEVSAIPDTRLSQYQMDEGSETLLNNLVDGQPNATIDGADWVENSNRVGGFWLDFDGDDDGVVVDSLFDFVNSDSQYSFAITVDTSNETDGVIWGAGIDGDYGISTGFDSGDLVARLFADGGSTDIEQGANISDEPNLVRFGVEVDPINDNLDIYINGELKNDASGDPGTGASDFNSLGFRASDNDNHVDVLLDNPTWDDGLIGQSGYQDDYDAQPWS